MYYNSALTKRRAPFEIDAHGFFRFVCTFNFTTNIINAVVCMYGFMDVYSPFTPLSPFFKLSYRGIAYFFYFPRANMILDSAVATALIFRVPLFVL